MNKDTIPAAYDFLANEDKIYQMWLESGFFNPDNLSCADDAEAFTIVLPPPNVTGTLHMGHAGMLAIEDILIRFYRMKGKRVLWVPGTDHAAIATQTKVEKIIKKEGLNRHVLGREKFLERVHKFAQDSHDTIINQCKKMGASLDWSREAFTLDETRNKAVNLVFKLMYDDGLIYRGERIVNWCPRCHSTLADDEVEHKEQKAVLYYFKYDKNFPITIATTRPETKLGDTAVAVNPKDERYLDYIGREFSVDFAGVPLTIKVIADREVDMNFGTGALGVTPAHSMVDWKMAEDNNLEIVKVIDEDGKICPGRGEFSGLPVSEARDRIVEKLREDDLIEKEEEITNSLSICYRCDTPIEPLPSLQWFINVNKHLFERPEALMKKTIDWEGKSIKDICLEVVRSGQIKIIPERFEKSYYNWMENLRDWCISRQIWYGHRVPVWYRDHAAHSTQHTANDSQTEIYIGSETPEGEGWVRDEDTLDTWFSSGLWTFSTLAHSPEEITIENGRLKIDSDDFRRFHPNQVMETGYDILFFWVARMIIMTTYALDDIPFEKIYLHGLVLDEKGKKMSKSKGNVIDPLDAIAKHGTDAARLSLVIGSTPGNDMRLAEEKIGGFRNLMNKLWNVSRFILMSFDPDKGEVIDESKLENVDKWILDEFDELIFAVNQKIEDYEFSAAGELLRDFTKDKLADWYIEMCKFSGSSEKEKVLFFILKNLLKLWHPFIPFITEAIRQMIPGEKNLLMIENYPEGEIGYSMEDEQAAPVKENINLIVDVIKSIRNARAENQVEPSRKIWTVIHAGQFADLILANTPLIKGMRTGVGELEVYESGVEIENAVKVLSGPAGAIKIFLVDAIDTEKEKNRLNKEIAKLNLLFNGIKAKLDNQEFVERAPKEMVEREQVRLNETKTKIEELKGQVEKM